MHGKNRISDVRMVRGDSLEDQPKHYAKSSHFQESVTGTMSEIDSFHDGDTTNSSMTFDGTIFLQFVENLKQQIGDHNFSQEAWTQRFKSPQVEAEYIQKRSDYIYTIIIRFQWIIFIALAIVIFYFFIVGAWIMLIVSLAAVIFTAYKSLQLKKYRKAKICEQFTMGVYTILTALYILIAFAAEVPMNISMVSISMMYFVTMLPVDVSRHLKCAHLNWIAYTIATFIPFTASDWFIVTTITTMTMIVFSNEAIVLDMQARRSFVYDCSIEAANKESSDSRNRTKKLVKRLYPRKISESIVEFMQSNITFYSGKCVLVLLVWDEGDQNEQSMVRRSMMTSLQRSVDKFSKRYKFEKLKSIGNKTLFVGNLFETLEDTECKHWALLFCQDMVAQLKGTLMKDWRIVVHYGSLTGGILQHEKQTFECFGDALEKIMLVAELSKGCDLLVTEEASMLFHDLSKLHRSTRVANRIVPFLIISLHDLQSHTSRLSFTGQSLSFLESRKVQDSKEPGRLISAEEYSKRLSFRDCLGFRKVKDESAYDEWISNQAYSLDARFQSILVIITYLVLSIVRLFIISHFIKEDYWCSIAECIRFLVILPCLVLVTLYLQLASLMTSSLQKAGISPRTIIRCIFLTINIGTLISESANISYFNMSKINYTTYGLLTNEHVVWICWTLASRFVRFRFKSILLCVYIAYCTVCRMLQDIPWMPLSLIALSMYIITILLGSFACGFSLERKSRMEFLKWSEQKAAINDANDEREYLESVVSSVVPLHISNALRNDRNAANISSQSVAILFLKILNWADIVTNLNSVQKMEYASEFFTYAEALCQTYKVELVHIFGGGCLILAGAIEKEGRPETKCLNLWKEMQVCAPSYMFGKQDTRVHIGAAIATGTVCGGIVGHKRVSFDVWGRPVTEVMRMAHILSGNTLLVNELCKANLGDHVGIVYENDGPAEEFVGSKVFRAESFTDVWQTFKQHIDWADFQ